MDFYIIAAVPSNVLLPSIVSALDYHDIRYVQLCFLRELDNWRTVCLPKSSKTHVLTYWKILISSDYWHRYSKNEHLLQNGQLTNRRNICSVESQGQGGQEVSDVATGCDVYDINSVDVVMDSDVARMVMTLITTSKWNNVLVLHESKYGKFWYLVLFLCRCIFVTVITGRW